MDIEAAMRSGLGADERAFTIARLLAVRAAASPDAPAIAAPGMADLSYGALADHLGDVAARLAALGVQPGCRVALVLPEGSACAATLLAVAQFTTCAPLDPALPADVLADTLDRIGPALLLVAAETAADVRAAAAARGIATAEVRPDPAVAGCFTVHTASPPAMPSPLAAGAAHPDDVALLLSTSGTSGRRRLAPLTQTNLLASAFASRTLRGLEASDRCLDMMRMFHIAFVGDLLATLVAGGCAVCPPGFDGDRVFAWLEECRVTWYIAPPPIHRAILDRAPAHRAAIARGRLRFVRCASSHLTPELRQGLEAAFGVPALGGYGMTEAGPIITNEQPPPAPRRLGSVGVAIGPEVEIRGNQGESLAAGEIGEIVLHGPNIFAGYLDDPAANAEAFTPDGWFRTGDLGAFDEDGHLFLHGRSQEQINRGGQKVAPQEVEAVLERHPAVAAAVAFAVPDDRLGEAVAAAIQPVAGATVDPDDVRRFAATRLAPYQTPRRIVVVEALPQTATGKRRRIGLADLLGVTTPGPVPAAADRVPPRTALETLLAAIWAEVLGRPDIGVDDDFFAAGGDSLAATRVVARIRQALGVELSVPEFFAAPTVGGLAWTVETAAGSALPGDLSRFGSDARVPSTA